MGEVNKRKKEILKEREKNSMEYVKLLEEANSLRDKKDRLMKKDLELQQENVKLEPDMNKFDLHNRKASDIDNASENKRLELRKQINELNKEIQAHEKKTSESNEIGTVNIKKYLIKLHEEKL